MRRFSLARNMVNRNRIQIKFNVCVIYAQLLRTIWFIRVVLILGFWFCSFVCLILTNHIHVIYTFSYIWILDNCPENKVQPFCQGLSRCKGEVRIHVKFKFSIKECERVFSNNTISRNKPVFILLGLIIKTYEKMPVKTNNLVTLSVSISFFFSYFIVISKWC